MSQSFLLPFGFFLPVLPKKKNLGLTGTVLMNLIAVDWAWYSHIMIQPWVVFVFVPLVICVLKPWEENEFYEYVRQNIIKLP